MKNSPWSLVFLLAMATPCAADVAKPSRPNIVLILADDLGLPALGCYGGIYKTPNLDALAASGTRFERCFSAPLCAPSRAMLMTGRYAFRTGVTSNGLGAQATPQKDGCVALLLKQAGYATAVAGKWRQLSHFTSKADGAAWGFDEFLIWGAGQPEEGEETGERKNKRAAGGKKRPDRYWEPDYNLNGSTLDDAAGKYGPDVLQQFVIDFIRRHKSEPFFVYYPSPLIHGPILRTPDSKTGPKTGAGEKLKGKKDPARSGEGSLYADNIAYLDKQVGELMAELDVLNLRNNTLLVFVGDNGSVPVGTINGRTIDGHKSQLLEGGSRVPLIASWPAAQATGTVVSDLVDFSDFLPTFAELAGAPLPSGLAVDGQSFAGRLRGETGQSRQYVYVQLREKYYVRSDRWKLTGAGELFDMRDAPFAEVLVPGDKDDEAAVAARQTLQSALDKLRSDAPSTPAPVKRKKKKQAAT